MSSGPVIKLAMTFVFGNCSSMILINTVIGMQRIIPGTPQRNPQNMSITKMVITLIENDLPIKMGSKMPPIMSCTSVIVSIKNNKIPVGSNSIKANMDKHNTEIIEPII